MPSFDVLAWQRGLAHAGVPIIRIAVTGIDDGTVLEIDCGVTAVEIFHERHGFAIYRPNLALDANAEWHVVHTIAEACALIAGWVASEGGTR